MSPRARVLALVAAAATAAAAAVVAGAVLQGGSGDAEPRADPPPLELTVLRGEPHGEALRAAERAYERGDRAQARARFDRVLTRDPSSVPAAVGAAVAAWPDRTVERLREVVARHPDSALARLHLGLALFVEGEREEAQGQWRAAEARDPDSPAALRAEDLLHPDFPPGRPFFLPRPGTVPPLDGRASEERLEILRRRAEAGAARDWLALGVALQRAGRPLSARDAFDRARALAPRSLEARVAAGIARFDKDDPAAAFSQVGPLVRRHGGSPLLRFHLGLLLLWVGEVDEARRQLELAAGRGRGDFYAREARELLTRLGDR